MAEVLGSAVLELSTDDRQLRRGIANAEAASRQGLRNLRNIALGVGAVGATAAISFGAAMVKAGAEVENAFAEVRTLLPQIGDEAFGALQKDVLDLGREMNVASSDLIPSLYQAISAGIPENNVVDFLKIASEAAVGGVTDLETAVDGITSVVNAYGAETVDAQKASDLLFTAVRLGKTDMTQLSKRLFNVVPIAANLGVKFEEVTASLALMTAQGVPTAQATTMLRQLFTEASKSGTALSDSIQELTGQSLPDLISDGANVSWVMDELRRSLPEQEFRDLFSSIEASNAAMLITGPNAAAMTANLAEMGEATGATSAAFQTMSGTTMFKVQKALNSVKTTVAEWGMNLLNVLVPAIENHVMPLLGAFGELASSVGNLISTTWNAFAVWLGAESGGALISTFFEALGTIMATATESISGIAETVDSLTGSVSSLVDGKGFKGFWDGLFGAGEKEEVDKAEVSVSDLSDSIDDLNKPAPTGGETALQKAKREVAEVVSEFAKLPPETRNVAQEFSRLPAGAKLATGALSALGGDAADSANALRQLDLDAKESALAFLALPEPVQDTARTFFDLKPEAQAVALNLAGIGGGALIAIAGLQGLDAPTRKAVTEFANLTPEAQYAAVALQSMAPNTRQAVLALSGLTPEARDAVIALQGLPPETRSAVTEFLNLTPEAQKSAGAMDKLDPSTRAVVTDLQNLTPEAQGAAKAFLNLTPEARDAVIAFGDLTPEARDAALELEGADAATKAAVLNFGALPPEVRTAAKAFLELTPEAQKSAIEFAALNPEMRNTVLETGALPAEARAAALALAELGPEAQAATLEFLGLSPEARATADEFLNLEPKARDAALALEKMTPKGRAVVQTLADLTPEARASAAALLDMDPDARKAALALEDMDPTVRDAALALGDTKLEASDLSSELATLGAESDTAKPKVHALFSPGWWWSTALSVAGVGLSLAGINIPLVGENAETATPKIKGFLGQIGGTLESSPIASIRAVGLILSGIAGSTKETGDESETAEPKVKSLWDVIGGLIETRLAKWQTSLNNFKWSLLASALAGGLWLWGQYNNVTQWFSDVTTSFQETWDSLPGLIETAWTSITTFLSTQSALMIEDFRTLGNWISGVWQVAWDGLKQTVTDWWTNLKTDYGIESTGFQAAIDLNLGLIKDIWTVAWAALRLIVSEWWTNLKAEYEIESTGFQAGIDLAMALLNIAWENAWAALKQVVSDWWANLKSEYEIESTGFQSGIDLAMALLNIVWQSAWDGIKQIVKDAWADIKATAMGIANDVIRIVNNIIRSINKPIRAWNALKFSTPNIGKTFTYPVGLPTNPFDLSTIPTKSKFFGIQGFDINTPNLTPLSMVSPIGGGGGGIMPEGSIAMLGTGGIVNGPTLAMLGEGGGAEAVIPLDSPQASRFGMGGGQPTVVINADTINGWDQLRDLLAEAGLEVQLSGARDSFAGI